MTAEMYAARKEAGQCVYQPSCNEPTDGSVWCAAHHARSLEYAKALRRRRRRYHKRKQREFRAKRVELGICVRCNQPSVTKLLCEKHRAQCLAEYKARKGPVKRITKCSGCGQPGHRVNTCAQRPALAVGDVTDYLSAGSSNLAAAQELAR